MSVTPGSSSKLNTVRGVSAMLVTTSAEETSLATKVLPANILVKKSDDKIYITDGIKTLANIDPLIDQVLTSAEKTSLSTAFSTGSYVAAAGGVVVHGANGKIDDGSLNVVDNGKLVESYLSEYIDTTTHKVLLSALPDTVRAGVTYVADITARDALSAEQKKSLAFVIDATDDPTVTSGAAMYGWDASANSGAGEWIKIAEVESLDLNVAEIECSYTNAQDAGAIMYDHPLLIDPLTATDLAALGIEAAVVEIYVFSSNNTTWILTSNGELYGCGYGDSGGQGSGGTDDVLTFTKRAENVKEVICTDMTTWYIDNNNNLYGCGSNSYGQQGTGASGWDVNVKTFTKKAENVKEVSCSKSTIWYIDNNNDLYGCGSGGNGQQGSDGTDDVLTFTKRAENVKEVSCSDETTWYIDNNNNLYGCGDVYAGQQGSGTSGNSAKVLTFTKRASNVKTVSCSQYTTWYIDNNNNLYGCGYNNRGQQGSGDKNNVLTFTKRAENVKEVICTEATTWYIDNNNDLYGCGNGSSGQQGTDGTDDVKTFTKRAENVKEVICTENTTWYIDNNNDLYGCGNGSSGQQGTGASGWDVNVKTFTKKAENVKEVSCSDETTWYIDNNNNLYSCGENGYGQQGSGDTTDVLVFTKRDYKTE